MARRPPQIRSFPTFHAAASAALVAGVAVLASGCGGGAKPTAAAAGTTTATTATTATTTTSTAPRAAADQALFTYAACMRGKGVAIPDPVRGSNGRYAFPKIPAKVLSAPGVRAKAQACAAQLPQGVFGRANATPAQRADFQKFATCMRQNGVTLGTGGRRPGQNGQQQPLPVVPGQRPPTGTTGRRGLFDSTDPKVQAALAKCRGLLPTGLGNRAPQ